MAKIIEDIKVYSSDSIIPIIKFAKAFKADMDVPTDVWDKANAVANQPVWLAPTASRIHTFVSSSALDTMVATYYGLKSWTDTERSQDTITLTGQTPTNTPVGWVIIDRIVARGNVGLITATSAAPDTTITAQILAGAGQTKMSPFGIPTDWTFFLNNYSVSMIKNAAATTCEMTLLENEDPIGDTTLFTEKDDNGLDSTGTSVLTEVFDPPYTFPGPGLVKIQVNSSRADTVVTGKLIGTLVKNSFIDKLKASGYNG